MGIKSDDEKQTYTVDEAIVTMGFGKFQLCVLAYAGMGWISEAMEMMLLSFVGPAVQSLWHLSPNQESLITSVVFAGMLVGAYSWGIVSDNFGRRWALYQIRHLLFLIFIQCFLEIFGVHSLLPFLFKGGAYLSVY